MVLAVTGEIDAALPVATGVAVVPDVAILPGVISKGPPYVPSAFKLPVASTPVKAIMDPLVTVELAVAKV